MKTVILLDIEHCILEYPITPESSFDDSITLLKFNCHRLEELCKQYNIDIVITSTWCSRTLGFENDTLAFTGTTHQSNGYRVYEVLHKYLNEYIIGTTSKHKPTVIKQYKQDRTIKKVLVLDSDYNLETECNNNNGSHFVEVNGFMTNKIIEHICSILR